VATRAAGEPRPLNRRSCLGEGVTASTHGDHKSQGMGGEAVATCVRAAGVRRRCRWSVGASWFRAACERVVCGNVGLGANVGARPWDRWSQRGTGVRARGVGGDSSRLQKKEWVLNGFSSKTLGTYGQFRNKITFIP
jgi:hypothetical protein